MTEEQLMDRQVRHRLAVLRHAEEVTGNVALTCRYYGITRQTFYIWKRRYDEECPRSKNVRVVGSSRLPTCRPSRISAARTTCPPQGDGAGPPCRSNGHTGRVRIMMRRGAC
jgi:Helix-turn-helix domain